MWQSIVLAIVILLLVVLGIVWYRKRRLNFGGDIKKWTSEGLGWAVFDAQHAGEEKYAEWKQQGIDSLQGVKDLHRTFFAELEQLCKKYRVNIMSQQEIVGSACVVGSLKNCEGLKQELEQRGLGNMVRNEMMFRAAA